MKFTAIVNHNESFKVAKVSQVVEHVAQLPNMSLTISASEQLLSWISQSLNQSDDLIVTDILNCLAAVVMIKEVKLAKVGYNMKINVSLIVLL